MENYEVVGGHAIPAVSVGSEFAVSGDAQAVYVYENAASVALDAARGGISACNAIPVRVLTIQQAEALGLRLQAGPAIPIVLVPSSTSLSSRIAKPVVAINDWQTSQPAGNWWDVAGTPTVFWDMNNAAKVWKTYPTPPVLAANGDTVQRIDTSSGIGAMSQGTLSRRGIYRVAEYNGKSVIRLDATNDHINNGIQLSQPSRTIIIVVSVTTDAGGHIFTQTSSQDDFWYSAPENGGTIGIAFGGETYLEKTSVGSGLKVLVLQSDDGVFYDAYINSTTPSAVPIANYNPGWSYQYNFMPILGTFAGAGCDFAAYGMFQPMLADPTVLIQAAATYYGISLT